MLAYVWIRCDKGMIKLMNVFIIYLFICMILNKQGIFTTCEQILNSEQCGDVNESLNLNCLWVNGIKICKAVVVACDEIDEEAWCVESGSSTCGDCFWLKDALATIGICVIKV
jgi:hypothetical protein